MPLNPLYRIEVKDVPAQDVAVVAARVPAGEVDEWLRAAIRELIAVAGQRGTGPPFSVVPDARAEGMVDVEAVLPVVASMRPSGRIERREDPAYRAIVALHHGSHDELPTLRVVLRHAMRRQGVVPAGAPRDVYLSEPDDGRSLTEVVLPIDVPAGWRPSPALFTEPLTP